MAGLELQAESRSDAITILMGEFEQDVDPVVPIPGNLQPFLIRARDGRADIKHKAKSGDCGLGLHVKRGKRSTRR